MLVKKRRYQRLKPILKAKKQWRFIYSLAKELGKTVAELCETLTVEELIGWFAYAELENEEYEKQKEQAQRSSALKRKRR